MSISDSNLLSIKLDSRYFKGLEGQYSFLLQFLLQEENAKPGEYIVRARASQSWWPTRSISAEVHLEPGKYEVLPKLSATRDLTKPIVEDVVRKAAEENPQKLRQIGLNYDIAHAKGGFAEEEEERKKKLEKEKKLKEEKLKKKMADEQKLEAEKIEKGKVDGVPVEVKEVEVKTENGDNEKLEGGTEEKAKPDAENAVTEVVIQNGPTADADKNEVVTKEDKVEERAEEKMEEKAEEKIEKKAEEKVDGEVPSGEAKSGQEPNINEEVKSASQKQPESENLEPESATEVNANESPNPWNAVAVIGLRVYSKDRKLTIRLVKPKDPEEAAMLDVDGGISGAGATS